MIKDLVIIDPTRSHNDEDTHKSLVLFHEFGENAGNSNQNDKLNRIGIIQGLWSLTESFGSDTDAEIEKVIELDNEIIIVIKLEDQFFIALSINDYDNLDDIPVNKNKIPYQYYLGHLWLCYKFFVLQHGTFLKFEDNSELTDCLNEHVVTFWNDIYLKPETLIRQGIDVLFPGSFKRSELGDLIGSEPHEEEIDDETWDTMINRKILLQDESYLGIKDILVYNLPSDFNKDKNKNDSESQSRVGTKYFGLVENFCRTFDSLPDISNWIYHLFKQYDNISSHVLAGNTHFTGIPSTENQQNDTTNTIPGEETSNISTFGNRFYHNMTLPISFAYDVVQEVGVTTGVSSSVSYLKSYIPSWTTQSHKNDFIDSPQKKRYGYLISPLANSQLPSNYKMIPMYLKFGTHYDFYNVLFWYFEDILVVIICEKTFDKVWEADYLNDLSFILSLSMEKLYHKVEKVKRPMQENFGYFIVEKGKSVTEIKSSIPSCIGLLKQELNGMSPLNVVIDGWDKLMNQERDNDGIIGLDIMGSLFQIGKPTEKLIKDTKSMNNPYNNTFLDSMEVDKLWILSKELLIFLKSLDKSETRSELVEERLLTLSNGVLCYIKNDNNRLVIILKNWFDSKYDDYPTKETTLFNNLGIDVTSWWAKKKYNLDM
ncbi:vacuolar fusion protein ccz1 [Maudiozyma exigua]|uniref:Vacuolar fusion protein ccz1 n=1 Tax=Maudiozyma exigua TaxID=34358 RepID=A0A9P7BB70_MAUEX|nr:vacuolar fusion protein ccz1 [Kazachstania exigua]